MNLTRQKLLQAAAATFSEHGAAATSARSIATRAGVNQALVFYHFGTVSELIAAACQDRLDEAVEQYRTQFSAVSSLSELLAVGRELNVREREVGNVLLMAQLMASAAHDPVLAGAARHGMDLWTAEIEAVLRRVLRGSPLTEITDIAGLARMVCASFIGLELYEGADADGASRALEALDRLAVLVEVVDDLGPVARRALKAKLNRAPTGAKAAPRRRPATAGKAEP